MLVVTIPVIIISHNNDIIVDEEHDNISMDHIERADDHEKWSQQIWITAIFTKHNKYTEGV